MTFSVNFSDYVILRGLTNDVNKKVYFFQKFFSHNKERLSRTKKRKDVIGIIGQFQKNLVII